ncbi:hypothetical protein CQW23_11710 [Capsicum baccatum]|uniref:Uncharacterized protein n=1 Tax=Capsicum baccatum TaxID=33114 RepID=A0A2G2WQL4_CAPBA|nr:hypothetical protein CQW23_11710 [Capsicum baccatum]
MCTHVRLSQRQVIIHAADSALSDKGLAIIGSRCSRLLKLDLENCEAKGIQAIVRISTTLRDKLEKVSSSQGRISISYSAFILITELARRKRTGVEKELGCMWDLVLSQFHNSPASHPTSIS